MECPLYMSTIKHGEPTARLGDAVLREGDRPEEVKLGHYREEKRSGQRHHLRCQFFFALTKDLYCDKLTRHYAWYHHSSRGTRRAQRSVITCGVPRSRNKLLGPK